MLPICSTHKDIVWSRCKMQNEVLYSTNAKTFTVFCEIYHYFQ